MTATRADVLIAGGGPGGLAAALALRRAMPDVRIKVFEGSSGYRMQGSGVLFNPNGQKALEAIDPAVLAKLRDGGAPPQNLKRFTIHGKKMEALRYARALSIRQAEAMPPRDYVGDLPKRYGYKPFLTGWHEIRQALYEPVADLVQFEHKATRYDTDDEGVTLHFQQGDSVQGSALVICDGYWSRLRQQCLGDGPPNFAGTVMWRAREAQPEGHSAEDACCLQCGKHGAAWTCVAPLKELEARGITFDADTKQMLSVHHEAADLSAQQGPSDYVRPAEVFEGVETPAPTDGQHTNNNCLKVFADYPEEMRSMVANTDCSTITQHGLYMRDIDSLPRQWGKGLVTFVGDSMHATIPNGQGMMLTLEDAAVLAWHLQQGGLNAESMRRYEAERTPRIQDVVKNGHDGATYEDSERLHYTVKFNSLQPQKSW